MSKNKLYQSLGLSINTNSVQVNDDQYSSIVSEGLKDFLDMNGNRVNDSVSSRLVKNVLKRCRNGGMSKSDFGIAYSATAEVRNKKNKSIQAQVDEAMEFYENIKEYDSLINSKITKVKFESKFSDKFYENITDKNHKFRKWDLYYKTNQQMDMDNFRCFILLAFVLNWLDQRQKPNLPHPSEYEWGTPRSGNMDSYLRRWKHFERPSETDEFLERIDVISSVLELIRNKKEICFLSVYKYFIFEKSFRENHESTHSKASVSQILQRFGAGKSFESRFQENDNSNIIKVLFDMDDPELVAEYKDIAKFKRGGDKIDKMKIKSRNKITGKYD